MQRTLAMIGDSRLHSCVALVLPRDSSNAKLVRDTDQETLPKLVLCGE